MSWFSNQRPSLVDLLRGQAAKLDDMFGPGGYSLAEGRSETCWLRTATLAAEFTYDRRDQWVSACLRPLNLPEAMCEDGYFPDQWLRFLDVEGSDRLSPPLKGKLDSALVANELDRVRQVLPILADPQVARDACHFLRGYDQAYNDWASQEGPWTPQPDA